MPVQPKRNQLAASEGSDDDIFQANRFTSGSAFFSDFFRPSAFGLRISSHARHLRGLKQMPPMPHSTPNILKTPLPIDERRLQQQIDALAAISESPAPVVTRVLFSDADLQARAFVKALCQ